MGIAPRFGNQCRTNSASSFHPHARSPSGVRSVIAKLAAEEVYNKNGQLIDIEKVEYPDPPTADDIYNAAFINGLPVDRVLKAIVLVAAEKWSMTPAQLRAAIKGKL